MGLLIGLAFGSFLFFNFDALLVKYGVRFPINVPILDYVIAQSIPYFEEVEREAENNRRISALIQDLILCESRGDEKALNPKDRDGSPSWGILQFKTSTLREFGLRYKLIDGKEDIMERIYDKDLQIETAREMIREFGHLKSFWKQQFPVCSRLMGLWE